MGNNNTKPKKVYTFEIDNFSKRITPFKSPLFSSGYYTWCINVYPKGRNGTNKGMSIDLEVQDNPSWPHNWSRLINFRFVVVNLSSVLKSKSFETAEFFSKKSPSIGFTTDLCLPKLQGNKFLVNDILKIEVYIYVSKILGGLDLPLVPEEKKDLVYVNGFQVLDSQVKLTKWIFETYPETALYIHPQDQELKTAYINILLSICTTLYNTPLEKITEDELINVSKGLLDLTQAGFKLEWLSEKLWKVSMERMKLSDYEAEAQELRNQLKNLELMMCNLKTESRELTI